MWPRAALFLLVNELGERFGFFVTRGLINQYLKSAFGLENGTAKSYVHLFNALGCLFPVMGGAISDSYLGKFNTVIAFSLLAFVGNILQSVFSIGGIVGQFGSYPIWAFLIPIILITMGSGSAKPCAISLAGDQFKDSSDLDKFYATHGMMMNLGILFAVTLIPSLKDYAGYPIAFSVSTAVYLLALVVFLAGRGVFRIVPPQHEFLPWTITKLVAHAAGRKMTGHASINWLDLASDRYNEEMIQEARQYLRVALILSPLIFMWVLHEQHITEWQNQYDMMNKNILGVTIPTESCSLAAALMIVVLLPVMGVLVFPALENRGMHVSLGLRVAIGYGCFLAAFFVSVLLQYKVNAAASNRVLMNNVTVSCERCISGAWQLPQWFLFSVGESITWPNLSLLAYSNVGPKLKASSVSLILLTIAIANFFIILVEPILNQLMDSINRQWCYVVLAVISFIVYLLLLNLWFIPSGSAYILSPGVSKNDDPLE